jgi:adenosylmethionine-8-amino-7-oxononanoate aminotransferase
MIKLAYQMSTKKIMSAHINQLIQSDLQHIWHPCSQMKDFELYPPLVVKQARGSYLDTDKGLIIDAISSWWCKSLGHGHPAIIAAMKQQLDRFEHVITANTTHPSLAMLGERLAEISHKQHVFFASDGSSAVEIALKLSLHAHQLQGRANRCEFIALSNSYHGETFATLSISDLGLYKKPYRHFGLTCHFIDTLPYVTGITDPLWHDAEASWQKTVTYLEKIKHNVSAIIVEPLLQGAGGMRCYSAYFLQQLASWAKNNTIYLIADEIMTGFGRTGAWFACHHANIDPDLICLSKGLTSGAMPLSCVLIDHSIYQLFYHDYSENKSFLHSHTYSGNALAVSAALATIEVMTNENINQKVDILGKLMLQQFTDIATSTGKLTNIRALGAMVAGDLVDNNSPRLGYQFCQAALINGALMRPLGNTVYWLPPLNTDELTILRLADITYKTIEEIYRKTNR